MTSEENRIWLDGHGFSCVDGEWRRVRDGIDVEVWSAGSGWTALLNNGHARVGAHSESAQSAVRSAAEAAMRQIGGKINVLKKARERLDRLREER